MAAIPRTMRAWTVRSSGSPLSVLSFNSHHSVPERLSQDGVLIKVAYASISPAGAMMMSMPSLLRRTRIPEVEFSGCIHAISPSLSSSSKTARLAPGTPVFGLIPMGANMLGRSGALAEYVNISAEACIEPPAELPLSAAAALPVNGATALAYAATARSAGVELKGARILVNGASGGVGSMAVQVARAAGATVVGVCSRRNVAWVREQPGADDVVDYTAGDVGAQLRDRYGADAFDAVFDTMGSQQLFEASPTFLKPSGVYVSGGTYVHGMFWTMWYMLKNSIWPAWLGGTSWRFKIVGAQPNIDRTRELVELVKEGKLTVPVDRTVPMEDLKQAYEHLLSKRARGKIVIDVQGQKTT